MNSRKKNGRKKRKLGSLLLLLFLTIILLATSTYAWFTANRNVTIDAINVTVSTSNGIQISTDANSWKTLISNSDITTGYSYDAESTDPEVPPVIDQNQFRLGQLSPVSTAGAISSGKLVMYKGVIDDKNSDGVLGLTATATAAETKSTTTGDFLAFDIFLKLDEAGTVYLDAGSGATVTGVLADKGAQNAVRFGFIIEGNGASTLAPRALAAYSSGSSVLIVEPNSDQHNAYGIEQARQYYQDYTYGGGAQGASYTSLSVGTGNGWVSWDGVSAPISDQNEIAWPNTNATDNGTYFTAMTGSNVTRTNAAFSTNTGSPAPTPVDIGLSLSAGVTKIRVYIWIEGQDIDCDTSASGANITFNIGFTLDQ